MSLIKKLLFESFKKSSDWLYHVTNIKYIGELDIDNNTVYPYLGDIVKTTEMHQYWKEHKKSGQLREEQEEIDGMIFFSDEPHMAYADRKLASGGTVFNKEFIENEVLVVVVEKNDSIYQMTDSMNRKVVDHTGTEVDYIEWGFNNYISTERLPYWIEQDDWFSFDEQEYIHLLYGDKLIKFLQMNYPNKIK